MYEADIKDPEQDERRRVLMELGYALLEKREEAIQFRASSGVEQPQTYYAPMQ